MSSAIDRANRVEMMSALVADAVLAPSMHNTQPWTFVADDSSIDLFADSTRDLQIADPQHRARTISCGAALFNLRVAAAHRGIGVRVTGFPNGPVDLTHVAHVDLDAGPVEIELAELHDAVALRHTNRNPFSDEPIPTRDLRDLELAVVERNACLEWMVDPYARHRLAELTAEATLSDTYDPVRDAERALWIGDPRRSRNDGIPAVALGPRADYHPLAGRDFGRLHHSSARPLEHAEDRPSIAVLSTLTDEPGDWLDAGQALEHFLLLATDRGLAASFLNAVLEYPDLRAWVQDPRGPMRKFQMIIRVGRGLPMAGTRRRPLAEVLYFRPSPFDGRGRTARRGID